MFPTVSCCEENRFSYVNKYIAVKIRILTKFFNSGGVQKEERDKCFHSTYQGTICQIAVSRS